MRMRRSYSSGSVSKVKAIHGSKSTERMRNGYIKRRGSEDTLDQGESDDEETGSVTLTHSSLDSKMALTGGIHGSKKKPRKRRVTANLSGTKYDIVRKACLAVGMAIRDDDPNSYLIWHDASVTGEKIVELKSFQKLNHFPSMGEICRKDSLARNMSKMQRAHPDEYNFVPQTWVLPGEYPALQNYYRELKKKKKSKTFIVKPANGAMGNGIGLIRNIDRLSSHEQLVVQEYMDKPLLIDGMKFDLRLYVLVTSADPLRVFLFNEGLVRLSTEAYHSPTEENLDNLYMHLTNYSVNKHNENYERDEDVDRGSKRSLKFFREWLVEHEYDASLFWRNVMDLTMKTIIVAQPHVLHSYRMCRPGTSPGSDSVCFEILGFDVLVDRKLRPWLLEVNRAPSFGTDSKLDFEIKLALMTDTVRLLNIKPGDRRRGIAAQKAESQRRLLMQPKRSEYTMSELDKKKAVLNKRKGELKERLNQLRRDSAREDFENQNKGNFWRVFPPDDKHKFEKYSGLLADAFKLFLSGRAATLQKDANQPFSTLREEEILDLLEQCEADENVDFRSGKGPKPLSSMPSARSTTSSGSLGKDQETISMYFAPARSQGVRPVSARLSRPSTATQLRKVNNNSSASPPMKFNPVVDSAYLKAAVQEREEELTKRTLQALTEMRIKFPGKSDEEAAEILESIHNDWKFHKPRVASYWLVKLDSIKRRKVVDIVKTNVRSILQRVWKANDVESLRLCRIFSRVFNRLLWSHGQGLWNCFNSVGNSWETIFSKSSDVLTTVEMNCCRRIVKLCCDCLLIVYQFASEAKATGSSHCHTGASAESKTRPLSAHYKSNGSSDMSSLQARLAHFYQTTYSDDKYYKPVTRLKMS